VKLWPHQLAAVDDFCGQVGDGERGTVVAACGTGKTLMAAECSVRLAGGDPVVVMVPTVELLAQTIREWRAHLGPAAGAVVAVCDARLIRQAARHAGIGLSDGVEVTTDPARLARLLARGRVTVVATYASLPVVKAAFGRHEARRAGLLVADEAHRTAGAVGKAWAAVHDELAVPARRRMYLTATPRFVVDDDEPVVSMDDTTIFGPVVHRIGFATAIELGLLADYRVVVAVVQAQELAGWGFDGDQVVTVRGKSRPAGMLASQIAIGRAMREYHLRRVLVYHSRIAAADVYAATLTDAVDLLPARERPGQPITAWSVSGRSHATHRARVLADLRGDGDRPVVVCNARLLGEGVDVPALDAVAFDSPRSSVVDVIQAVGRALRVGGQPGKTATILIPALTGQDHLAQGLQARDWRTLWQVVTALRAHDERVETQFSTLRGRSQQTGQDCGTGFEARTDAGPPGSLSWLTTIGPHVPAGFAQTIRLRMFTPASPQQLWQRRYAHAERFHAAHGHLDVPANTDDPDLARLGTWLQTQRGLYTAGSLHPDKIGLLERLGVIWHRHEHRWQSMLERLRQWLADGNSHQSLPDDIRMWINVQRRSQRMGELSPQRKAQLDGMGVQWDSPRETRWWDGLAHARAYQREHRHLRVPTTHVADDGFTLGAWISQHRQDHHNGRLPADRTAALEALGMVWDVYADRFNRGVAALAAFRAEHGHARLPSSHPFHNWLRSLPQRVLSREQQQQLTALGIAPRDQQSHSPAMPKPTRARQQRPPPTATSKQPHRPSLAVSFHAANGPEN